ncbi:MAG: hypothetical protein GW778_03480 [Alphaproteobacteria bacterium]|nr:hypothetical protein [Alphaproteobacteria bacterium]
MMRVILIFLTLISSVIFIPFAHADETLPVVEFSDMRRSGQGEVADVLSPVTILMKDGTIIRLVGIDVPGMYKDDASVMAVTARDILRDLLAGQRVEIYQTTDKNSGLVNRMGQQLAHLKLAKGGFWAQGVLLKLGLARVKTTAANAHMADKMLVIERAAREEKIGIWANDAYGVVSADNAESAVGNFAIVEGRIQSVALKKNRLYINFGKNWRHDFTVSIAPEDKRAFSNARLDPMRWGRKRVRVRGSVRDYNGPYMEITHPGAIEFLDDDIALPEDAPREDALPQYVAPPQ